MALQSSGQISISDIATEFGDSAPHSMSEFYGAGGAPASGELKISDFYGLASFTMPSGIIIPFTGASTPSGWTAFTAANGRAIIGAGSSYSNGSTGGSSSFSKSASLASSGSHTSYQSGSGSGTPNCCTARGSAGAHSHTVTMTGSGHPSYKQYKLIKASGDQSSIPAGGIILGRSTITGDGVSNIDSGLNRIMYGGSSVTTGGSGTVSISGTSSSAGSHVHPVYGDGGDGSSAPRYGNSAGAHTHSASTTLTWNVKRMYLTAWQNASAAYSFEGAGIAMYESATPPSGWSLCNGANGTPDLRDYMVMIGTTSNHGTTSGNNSMSVSSVSATGGPTHSHYNQNVSAPTTSTSHGNAGWSHTHTGSLAAFTQLPPYYGLYFIQYTG